MLFAKNLAVACHLFTCCFSAPVPPSWVVIGDWDSATPSPACFLGFTIRKLAGIWKVREGSSDVSCVCIPPAGSGNYHFILRLLLAFPAPGMLCCSPQRYQLQGGPSWVERVPPVSSPHPLACPLTGLSTLPSVPPLERFKLELQGSSS